MNRFLVFGGLGVVVSSLFVFLLRLGSSKFLNSLWTGFVFFGVLGLFLFVGSWLFFRGKKGSRSGAKKFLRWFGLGVFLESLFVFLLRYLGLNNNLALFLIFLIIGVVMLFVGVVRK